MKVIFSTFFFSFADQGTNAYRGYLGMNFKSWMIALAALLLIGFPSTHLQAQSFEQGYKAFQDGNYRKARRYLIRGIKQTRDRYDKALMYKLLGISEYNLGRKSAAANNFKKAVRLDPAIRISRSESRNRRIVSLFKRIKSRSGGGSRGDRGGVSFRSARRGQNQASRRASSSGSSTSLVTNLLPVGIPQFMQGKTLTGAAIAAGQVAGAAIFFERNQAATAADNEALQIINEQQNSGNTTYDPDDFLAYIDANEAFVLKAREEANQGLLILIGAYAAGVLEATFNPPSTSSSRRRRADLEVHSKNIELAESEELESIYIAPESLAPPPGLRLMVLPNKHGVSGILAWKTEF